MSKGKTISRRSERARAFQVLYGLSFSPASSSVALRAAFLQSPDHTDKNEDDFRQGAEPGAAPEGFAWELVDGVWSHGETLDAFIGRFSHNWRVDRMGRVEVTLLRLGMFEMLYRTDIPPKVAINEALELAKQFGGHNAPSFINGILDAAAKALENGEISHQMEALQ